MDQKNNTMNKCSHHNSEYIVVDFSPQCKIENRFLCIQCCLGSTSSDKNNLKKLDEANIYLQEILSAFTQTQKQQSNRNLEVLKDLKSSIQSLKMDYNWLLDKIIGNLNEQETYVIQQQEILIVELQKMDLYNYFQSNNKLPILQYDQIKETIKTQIANLQKQDKIDKCLSKLLDIDVSMYKLETDSKQSCRTSQQLIQRTPHLHFQCQTHQLEITFFDISKSQEKEKRLACAQCVPLLSGQPIDLISAYKQWQDHEINKELLFQSQLDNGKQKVETVQRQFTDIHKYFNDKINKLIVHQQKLLQIEENNQQEFDQLNQDWLTLSRDQILYIADTLSNSQDKNNLRKSCENNFHKFYEDLNMLIDDSVKYLIFVLQQCNATLTQVDQKCINLTKQQNIFQIDYQRKDNNYNSQQLKLNQTIKSLEEEKNEFHVNRMWYERELLVLKKSQEESQQLNDSLKEQLQKLNLGKSISAEIQDQKVNQESQVIQKQIPTIIDRKMNQQGIIFQPKNSIKQQEACYAIAFNKEQTIMIAGCGKQIIVFEFKSGQLTEQQVLSDHSGDCYTLYFAKKTDQFVSGTANDIRIWSNNRRSYYCQKILKNAHSHHVQKVIMNKIEDLIISCSKDKTIKFWGRQYDWQCFYTLTNHSSYVFDICLNESCNQLVSCGQDEKIVISQQGSDLKWSVYQIIQGFGNRICFINDNIIVFQPQNGTRMETYKLTKGWVYGASFLKNKDVQIQNFISDESTLFKMQFNKQRQILLNKNGNKIYLIKKQNDDFIVEQSILFDTSLIFGAMTDDFQYLVTYDDKSQEIQVRKFE